MSSTASTTEPVYRLLATDLDGTLLGPDGALSRRTLRATRALHAARIPLVLATSRRLTGVTPVARTLGFPLSLILYDGALAYVWPEGKELFRDTLPAEVGQQVVEILAAHRLRPIVQHASDQGEYLLVGPRAPRSRKLDSYLAIYQHHVRELPLMSLCSGQNDPLRIVAFGDMRRLRPATRDISRLPCGWQLLTRGNYGTAELTIFSATASKATALARIARQAGVPMEHVVAIGDGVNDVGMVTTAGLGVAMANGGRAARGAADIIAPSNHDDGVAWAIERYLLNGRIIHDSPDDAEEKEVRAS